MSTPGLFGPDALPPPRTRASRRPATRHHNRRKAWEDYLEPELYAGDLFSHGDEIELTVRELHGGAEAVIRAAKVRLLRARHEAKVTLHHPTDPTNEAVDYVEKIFEFARRYREEALARRGLRNVAHGIYRVNPKNPWSRWRFRPWNPSTQRNEHKGYYATEWEAWHAAEAWYARHRKLDIRVPLPDWLEELVRTAVAARVG